ncbi:MAG: Ppx/GppA phosphatase family protein, partial [Flavobacteriales bacterium]
DVGGGSTELTYIVRGVRVKSQSFNIGAVRALEQKIQKKTWEELKNWIAEHIQDSEKIIAIGTGGNINTVFKMAGKKPSERISLREIEEQFELISELSYEDRVHKLKLKPDRADVVVPACEIYLKILQLSGIREMLVPKIGLSDGMILKMFEEHT